MENDWTKMIDEAEKGGYYVELQPPSVGLSEPGLIQQERRGESTTKI